MDNQWLIDGSSLMNDRFIIVDASLLVHPVDWRLNHSSEMVNTDGRLVVKEWLMIDL